MLTQERLKEVLYYSPDTGMFHWVTSRGRQAAGSVAGSIKGNGYIMISVDRKLYYAHRLAFLWMTGAWPAQLVDHADGVPTNNRWDNIREATHAQNIQHRCRQSNNKSGLKGVDFHEQRKKWRATIRVNGKQIYLGHYDTKEEAALAHDAGAREHHGEFAFTNFRSEPMKNSPYLDRPLRSEEEARREIEEKKERGK